MEETLAVLKSKNIKFVGICQPGCDATQMYYLVSLSKQVVLIQQHSDCVRALG